MINIHFHKSDQTRFLKHGFSWQLFCFGPLAFLMRAQYGLAAACLGIQFVVNLIITVALLLIFESMDAATARVIALIPMAFVAGKFGNRFSARSYVKNGWLPVDAFPQDWNTPQILPVASKAAG